jgi:hypothetical protein
MIACFVCGSQLEDTAKACSVCGTSLAAVSDADEPPPALSSSLPHTGVATPSPPAAAVGLRFCPACGRRYNADYFDIFCTCGSTLQADPAEPLDLPLENIASGLPETLPFDPSLSHEPAPLAMTGPRLVLYSSDLEPVYTLALDRDVTRIGRNDPIRGDFVDLDVSRFVDGETARKVSRKHAVILRSRETGTFTLRPLARSTGTQIESALAAELQDHPLTDGMRIILGGVVRLKFLTS